MHQGNREWLSYLQGIYGISWAGPDGRVLELGSLDVNGTGRDYLHAKNYVGVDIVAGKGVDVVCAAKDTVFEPSSFDAILCTSMLEHDPQWQRSVAHNVQWLKPEGFFFLSWGAEGNGHHAPEPWAFVPVGDVVEWVLRQPLRIVEAHWERSRFAGDCAGCYNMVLLRM